MKLQQFGWALVIVLAFSAGMSEAAKKSSRNFQSMAEKKAAAEAAEQKAAKEREAAAAARQRAEAQEKAQQKAQTVVEFTGPSTGWGFVQTETPFYSTAGKNLGKIAAGASFSYNGVKKSQRNSMLVVTFTETPSSSLDKGPYLIDCTKAAVYEGKVGEIDPELVGKLRNYFTLKGELDARKSELEEAVQKKNPYYGSLLEQKTAYQESCRLASEMEAKMNALQGASREKMLDKLRALKYQQTGLMQNYQKALQAYQGWKVQHPVPATLISGDAKVQELSARLKTVKSGIENLIPAESAK